MGEHRIQRQILQNVAFLRCQRNFRDFWWLSSNYYKPNPQSIKHSSLVAYVNPVRDPKDFSMWPIEFVADGIPPSQGSAESKVGGPWQKKLKNAASGQLVSSQPGSGPFVVAIAYFHTRLPSGRSMPDIDNIIKSVLDSLQGLVYRNDRRVSDVLCRRRDLDADEQIQNPTGFLIRNLADAKHMVYVVVDDAPIKEQHL